MTAPLVQRLSLVVDAVTGGTESRMEAVAEASRAVGESAARSAAQVAAAADRVADAQRKRDDATDRVALAERKLTEAQSRYAADSSQVLAAEQRLEAARRGLHVATRDVERATADSAQAQSDAAESAARLADEQAAAAQGSGELGESLADLAKVAAGVAIGAFLQGAPAAFADGARAAQGLALSMNATVEQGGRLAGLMSSLGLESDDLLEIQAEFAGKVAENADALGAFGAQVIENDNGTTNWALTLEDALINLQKIPDATQRNATGFALFGEEGYKQLSRLLTSGISVKDALDRIGTPFDEDDVRAAAEYDAAMSDLTSTASTLQQDIGRGVIPVLTAAGEVLGFIVDVVSLIPAPIGLATVAAVTFGIAARSAATEGTFLNTQLLAAQGAAARFTGAMGAATAGAGAAAGAMGVATVAGRGLMTVLGGPLGVALVAAGAGFALLNAVTGDNEEESEAAAAAQQSLAAALRESGGVITDNVREAAALAAEEKGVLEVAERAGVARGDVTEALLGNEQALERVRRQLEQHRDANQEWTTDTGTAVQSLTEEGEAAQDTLDDLESLLGTTRGNAEEQARLSGELDATTDAAATTQAAMDALVGSLEDGNVSTGTLATLARDVALAQDAEAEAMGRAEAAVDAYRARTDQAVEATLEFIDARYASESANFAFLSAMDAANEATDDGTTSVDEQRQAQVRLMEAALAAAQASADAAVENAEAAGQVVDDVAEAQIRADSMLFDLRGKLNTPGLTAGAREEMQLLIDRLQEAKDRGDIETVLTLTGVEQVTGDLDATTEDRDTTVAVESRGGPAVIRYLDSVAEDRLSLVRVESRNGPAVDDYLDGLAEERLAIIRVETRNGPAVDQYLDDLAGQRRVAVIDTQATGAGAAGGGGTGAGLFGATPLSIGQLIVQTQVDSGGRLSPGAQRLAGEQVVQSIREYERRNGTGWRRSP